MFTVSIFFVKIEICIYYQPILNKHILLQTMLSNSELDILKKAEKVLEKKRKIDNENEKMEFDNKKRKMFDDELDKLIGKKQKYLDEIENVDKHIEKYKQMYLKATNNAVTQVDKEIEKLGKYVGQCLHKEKKMCRYPNFECYDGFEEYYVCSLCKIKL